MGKGAWVEIGPGVCLVSPNIIMLHMKRKYVSIIF